MRIYEPTAKQEQRWARWVASRPDLVRRVAERFFPWELYLLKSTGQYGTVRSFFEDGTVSFAVTGEHQVVLFDRIVFGINPDDLVPSDGPEADELRGTLLSHQQVEDNIDVLRAIIRPDLWTMGADGVAVRKQ
jgi:hypothetical protein